MHTLISSKTLSVITGLSEVFFSSLNIIIAVCKTQFKKKISNIKIKFFRRDLKNNSCTKIFCVTFTIIMTRGENCEA